MLGSSNRLLFLALVLAITALLCSGCGGGSAASPTQRRLLSVTDLPEGWAAATSTTASGAKLTDAPCLSGLAAHANGSTYATASFVDVTSIPSLGEVLSSGPQVHRTWQRLERALGRCRNVTVPLGRLKVRASVRPLAFPSLGATTSAYAFTFTLAGIRLGFDLVLFETGRYVGYVVYSDLGGPQRATVAAFVKAAVAKATNGSTARIADTVSVVSAPVRTVETKLGRVAYRVVGAGPPLVLIMGYAGTMEVWDRRFVDALAQQHRVVIFDNAGIGGTQALAAPLTIDAMANQTSALITALGLGRVNVLSWSMGSMIAQALAVLHPTQVGRLVLAASYPGNGTTIQPPNRRSTH